VLKMSSSRVTRRNRRRDSPETETSQSAFPQQPHQTHAHSHASPSHASPPAAPLPPHAAPPSPGIALHLRSSHLIASHAGTGESANLAGAERTSPIPRPQPKRFLKLRLTVNHQKKEGLQGKRQTHTRKRGPDREEGDKGKEEEEGRDKENLVCVTEFMREEDYTALGITMPSLEAALGKKRRASSGLSREKPKQLTNGVGGSHRRATASNSNGTVHKSEPATSTSTSTNKHKQKKEDLEKSLERNIDTVIFGDVSFKAWYPSWYPKEIIGEKALDGKGAGITVTELYVCERCFGYAKTLLEWVRHCRCCERGVPGQRIYVHGSGEGEIDEDKGHWEVWEVDGEVETVSSLPVEYLHDMWGFAMERKYANDIISAILPKPLPLRQALPRQQICLLRRLRLQLFPPRLRSPIDSTVIITVPTKTPTNSRVLLQRKTILGQQQPSLYLDLPSLAKEIPRFLAHGREL
jgi:hypothetical protein